MKIFILGDGNNPHIIKWVNGILQYDNFELLLCSLLDFEENAYVENSKLSFVKLGLSKSIVKRNVNSLNKIQYVFKMLKIIKTVKRFNPKLIHAHFASSYGLLASFIPKYKFIVSVWGSDIYDFPNKSFIHKYITKWILWRATEILSTSNIMANEIKKYTNKNIKVIPFGIDIDRFNSSEDGLNYNDEIVIGTIKTLEPLYRIDDLIKAFAILKANNENIKLIIVGDGFQKEELQLLASKLGIQDFVKFIGRIPYNEVHLWHKKIDIYVALSSSESFGVAILEACASIKPVVVSDADGFREVVIDGVTGFIVPRHAPQDAANAIGKLIKDDELRRRFGENGRKHVFDNYNFPDNLKQMIDVYNGYR